MVRMFSWEIFSMKNKLDLKALASLIKMLIKRSAKEMFVLKCYKEWLTSFEDVFRLRDFNYLNSNPLEGHSSNKNKSGIGNVQVSHKVRTRHILFAVKNYVLVCDRCFMPDSLNHNKFYIPWIIKLV